MKKYIIAISVLACSFCEGKTNFKEIYDENSRSKSFDNMLGKIRTLKEECRKQADAIDNLPTDEQKEKLFGDFATFPPDFYRLSTEKKFHYLEKKHKRLALLLTLITEQNIQLCCHHDLSEKNRTLYKKIDELQKISIKNLKNILHEKTRDGEEKDKTIIQLQNVIRDLRFKYGEIEDRAD